MNVSKWTLCSRKYGKQKQNGFIEKGQQLLICVGLRFTLFVVYTSPAISFGFQRQPVNKTLPSDSTHTHTKLLYRCR